MRKIKLLFHKNDNNPHTQQRLSRSKPNLFADAQTNKSQSSKAQINQDQYNPRSLTAQNQKMYWAQV